MTLNKIAILTLVFAGGCALKSGPHQPGASSSSPITERSVRSHMEFLASDALNGRGSGTRDEWIAASYVASQMQSWGLEPLGDAGGYVQQIEVERSELAAPPVMSVGGKRFVHGKDAIVAWLGAARTSGPLQHFKPGDAITPGAIVIVPEGSEALAAVGSAGVLSAETPAIRKRWTTLAERNVGMLRLLGVQMDAPARVTLEKGAYAAIAKLPAGTVVTIEAEVKASRKTNTWNAVGRLTGSDPAAAREIILLSAHLDHIGVLAKPGAAGSDTINNGADDDASGTVAVMELARAISMGRRPKRTLVFALFGSEEVGGYGSRYFADKPVVPLDQVVANLQFEMIGRPDAAVPPHTLWLTGYERSTLGPSLAKQGAKLVKDPHPEMSFFTRSDNIQFAYRGVVAHTVSSFGLHKEYHQPSDEIRMIDFAHMTDAIRSLLEPVRWLANSSFKPEWLPGMKP